VQRGSEIVHLFHTLGSEVLFTYWVGELLWLNWQHAVQLWALLLQNAALCIRFWDLPADCRICCCDVSRVSILIDLFDCVNYFEL